MKIAKIEATGSNTITIKMKGGSAGALALVLVAVIGVVGAINICEIEADLRKERDKNRA